MPKQSMGGSEPVPYYELIRSALIREQRHGCDRERLVAHVAKQLRDARREVTDEDVKGGVKKAVTELALKGEILESITLHPGGKDEDWALPQRAEIFIRPSREGLVAYRKLVQDDEAPYLNFLIHLAGEITKRTDDRWPAVYHQSKGKGIPDAILDRVKDPRREVVIADIEVIHSGLDEFDMKLIAQFKWMEILMLYVRQVINSMDSVARTHTHYIQYSLMRQDRGRRGKPDSGEGAGRPRPRPQDDGQGHMFKSEA